MARAVLMLAVLALAACDAGATSTCPGRPIATFSFTIRYVSMGDPALANLDPEPSLPDCDPALAWPETVAPFRGELAGDGTGAAALCRDQGNVLFGRWSGASVHVETSTGGAVLGACDPTCAASLRLVVSGDLAVDASGAPTAFTGALVEIMDRSAGSCGACALPCEARYALAGAP